ncbi:hypothetical protein [Fulvivirga sp.]|uniref:hypothetical protein n=1 Tax=Fulvivirga sp. TaxID=1931237 RepID=UPI0032EF03D7
MDKPVLTIIAGCNGSGKSSFSSALSPPEIPPFDYDKEFLNFYRKEPDSELKERICHNKAKAVLKNLVEKSIANQTSFTYETNFNSTPLYWPEKFRKAEFGLRLFYFCLNSTEEAKRRVQIRVENGGHYVPDNEVVKRYYEGYHNLNLHWRYFDETFLFETSAYKSEPQHIISIIDQTVEIEAPIPEYLISLIPFILK